VNSPLHVIGDTIDDPLYQASRYAYPGAMSYAIPVRNGDYQVVLKFAEPYWEGARKRVFDVLVEGVVVVDDLDLVAAAGHNMAHDVTVDCAVTDGTIDISFSSVNREPLLSAILVVVDGVDIALRDADAPLGGSTHLAVEYYELSSPTELPDFSSLTPYAQDTVAVIDFPSTSDEFATSGRTDEVGAVFTGYFEATISGQYTFYLESDDGSELSIGDTAVIDNDGLHGMVIRSGSIGLKAGMHEMRVAYFEAAGGAGLVLSFDPPVDADGDGMADTWELINNVDDPDADPDGDGASNLAESIAGTDPHNADTDGDGLLDGWEIDDGTDPTAPDSPPPAGGDDAGATGSGGEFGCSAKRAPTAMGGQSGIAGILLLAAGAAALVRRRSVPGR